MKILYATDLHGSPKAYSAILNAAEVTACEAILICGDILPKRGFIKDSVSGQRDFANKTLRPMLEEFRERFCDVRIYWILGNDDWATNLDIIRQFNLYPEMQGKYPQEVIIETMRDNINIELIGAEVANRRQRQQEGVTIAFTVAYRGKDPQTVQRVASPLASFYLKENLKTREQHPPRRPAHFRSRGTHQLADDGGVGGRTQAFLSGSLCDL